MLTKHHLDNATNHKKYGIPIIDGTSLDDPSIRRGNHYNYHLGMVCGQSNLVRISLPSPFLCALSCIPKDGKKLISGIQAYASHSSLGYLYNRGTCNFVCLRSDTERPHTR